LLYNNGAGNAKTESGMFLTEFISEGHDERGFVYWELVAGCKLRVFMKSIYRLLSKEKYNKKNQWESIESWSRLIVRIVPKSNDSMYQKRTVASVSGL
jgi:hypothetical protein